MDTIFPTIDFSTPEDKNAALYGSQTPIYLTPMSFYVPTTPDTAMDVLSVTALKNTFKLKSEQGLKYEEQLKHKEIYLEHILIDTPHIQEEIIDNLGKFCKISVRSILQENSLADDYEPENVYTRIWYNPQARQLAQTNLPRPQQIQKCEIICNYYLEKDGGTVISLRRISGSPVGFMKFYSMILREFQLSYEMKTTCYKKFKTIPETHSQEDIEYKENIPSSNMEPHPDSSATKTTRTTSYPPAYKIKKE